MISLTLKEIDERCQIIDKPLVQTSGAISDVLQALDTFLLSNEHPGRAFDVTIEVYDEMASGDYDEQRMEGAR